MIQKTIFLGALMLQLGLSTAFAKIQTEKVSKEKEKIELKEKTHLVHSITFLEVAAYHDDSTVELFVNNFNVPVTLHIMEGGLSTTVEIEGTGCITMDISELTEGNYTLQVVLEHVV